MEATKVPQVQRQVVAIDDVKPGDIVYISTKEDASAYLILDVGKPFILFENQRTHFANLYRPTVLYKDVVCQ